MIIYTYNIIIGIDADSDDTLLETTVSVTLVMTDF
jgi:hypothetical protein